MRFDAHRDRWLPSGLPTPDGAGYVYSDTSGAVHRVTVDSGVDRVIVVGSWDPLGFVGDRLYLSERRPVVPSAFEGGGYTQGRVAQTSSEGGTPATVTEHAGPWWISSAGGWTMDRADGMRQAADRMVHLDLTTGAVEPWLSGVSNIMLAGFDLAGHPFVVSQGEPVRVVLVKERNAALEVYSGPRQSGWPGFPSYATGDRVWFSGFGIQEPKFEASAWVYSGSALRPTVGVAGAQVSVAGACL